ncbi:MAG: conjugal transfer protein [Rickettsiaceae bacterium]|nr:conjugal transfer protein [Rickettsiaceae bacterium]
MIRSLGLFFGLFIYAHQSLAASTCTGRFVNPITDIAWKDMFPISIGRHNLVSKNSDRDTPNPPNMFCVCTRNVAGIPIPVPGIALGFWEPIRLIDVTRTPFCMVNLGGIKIGGSSSRSIGGNDKSMSKEELQNRTSFYHTHYYLYPLIYWLELLTDMGCLEMGSFDLAYMSEFDPTYNDETLASILNAEAFIFSNPISQTACVADCVAATTKLPLDSMFWCAGCLGSIYPFTGYVQGHSGGVQASSLLAIRTIAKYHRMGLALRTSTDTSTWYDGELCRKGYAPLIKKSQYKLQMTFPIPTTKGDFTSNPLGMTDTFWHMGKEFPVNGEDFGYLLWRKKNCCFL